MKTIAVQLILIICILHHLFNNKKKCNEVYENKKPTQSILKLPPYTNLTIWGYDSITGKDWMTCIQYGDTIKPLIIEGWSEIL